MISLTDTGSPADTAAAHTLLQIIADPAAAKKRLDELAAEKQRSLDAMDSARKATADAVQKHSVANAALAEVKRTKDDLHARSLGVDAKHAATVEKEKHIAAELASFSSLKTRHEKDMANREAAVQAREDALAAREAAIAKLQIEVAAVKADTERKAAAIAAFNATLR